MRSTKRSSRALTISTLGPGALALLAALAPARAGADEPIELRDTWSGNVDFVITGATLAADTNNDKKVDALAQPGEVTIGALPPGAILKSARLYWAASQAPSMCQDPAKLDKEVSFKAPGAAAELVDADGCYCSVGAASYDMQLCYAEVSEWIDGPSGTYEVGDLDALVMDGDTHNASFALLLIYEADGVGPRRIGLYDGLWTMVESGNAMTTVSLGGLDVDAPPQGDLAWYVLEGDVGGNMDEFVEVSGKPGAKTHTPTDAINPANNPFNQTINTTMPPQTGTIGVDIDRFSISPALTAGDTSVDMTYSADLDKYWIAVNLIGVDVFEPALFPGSGKSWELTADADMNGAPTAGDTVTYTIHLENPGNADALLTISDPIPAEAASWEAGQLCGGALVDKADAFEVEGIALKVDASCDLTFDVVIGEVADQTIMENTAHADLGNGIDNKLVAADAELRRDGDGDGVFDNDDNCPEVENPDQADADDNGVGDACEGGGSTSGGGTGGETGTTGESASGTGDSGSGSGGSESAGSTGGGTSATATGAATSGSGSATAGESGDSAGVDEDGCGCRSGGGDPAPLLLVVGALALRRRRR